MNWKILLATGLLLACSAAALQAQQEPPDPIDYHTFTPELVMQHQQAIQLTGEQRELIKKEVLAAQEQFMELQWDLDHAMETFIGQLSQDRVQEQQALEVLDRILELESGIKHTHLVLAIRIKNALTPDQQAQLRKLRESS